ncbi:MAG: VanZ family protein [Bacteroidaceae bacterium]|nr:VanZ family protein [Bacteroidaceae bacterium]
MIKRHLPTLFLCAIIIVLSLIPTSEMPSVDSKFADKWAHLIMYGTLSMVAWWCQLHKKDKPSLSEDLSWAVVMPVCLGGLMELAQGQLTTWRSGDWMDFVANSIGVVLAFLFVMTGYALIKRYGKRG